jgi:hypothetical protein
MMTNHEDTQPLHDPLAELERHLISAYVAGAATTSTSCWRASTTMRDGCLPRRRDMPAVD